MPMVTFTPGKFITMARTSVCADVIHCYSTNALKPQNLRS